MHKLSIRVGAFAPMGARSTSVVAIAQLDDLPAWSIEYPTIGTAVKCLPDRGRLVSNILAANSEVVRQETSLDFHYDREAGTFTMANCQVDIQGYGDLFSFASSLGYLLGQQSMNDYALDCFTRAGFVVESNDGGVCILKFYAPLKKSGPSGPYELSLTLVFNFDERSFFIRVALEVNGALVSEIEQDDYDEEIGGAPVNLDNDIQDRLDCNGPEAITKAEGSQEALAAILDAARTASVILTYTRASA